VLTGDMNNYVSNLYALDLAAMFLILAFFNHSLAEEEKKLVPKSLLGKYKLNRNFCLLVAGVFVVSMVSFFDNFIVFTSTADDTTFHYTLRSVLWILALLVGWSRQLLERVMKPH
jgi:hypothetical protein